MEKSKRLDADQAIKYLKDNFGKKAKALAEDKEKTADIIDRAIKKAKKTNGGPIFEMLNKVLLMFSLVRDWAKGDYREVPRGSIIAIIGAVLYFLSPIDLIPDFLPGGYIDDAFILGLVLKQVGSDLNQYQEWKNCHEQEVSE